MHTHHSKELSSVSVSRGEAVLCETVDYQEAFMVWGPGAFAPLATSSNPHLCVMMFSPNSLWTGTKTLTQLESVACKDLKKVSPDPW